MNRYEVAFHVSNGNSNKLEVEADKYSVQAAERTAYFYLKDEPSPETVVTDVMFVRRRPGVRYFLDMADEFVEDPDFGKSIGLRVLMKTSLKLAPTGHITACSRYLVEDANAPAEMEGHLVEIVCKQELYDKNKIRHWVADWKVLE